VLELYFLLALARVIWACDWEGIISFVDRVGFLAILDPGIFCDGFDLACLFCCCRTYFYRYEFTKSILNISPSFSVCPAMRRMLLGEMFSFWHNPVIKYFSLSVLSDAYAMCYRRRTLSIEVCTYPSVCRRVWIWKTARLRCLGSGCNVEEVYQW
jgi:hypothetical protein